MKYLTLKRLMSWDPTYYSEAEILKMSGGRKQIKIDEIFDLKIKVEDKLWLLLREQIFTPRELWLMACDFAQRSLPCWYNIYSNDPRLCECVKVTRQFVDGKATQQQLDAARDAVRAAVEVAVEAAIEYDAKATVGAAVAAREAAWAVWDAAGYDPEAAARYAARAAVKAVKAVGHNTNAARVAHLAIVKKYWRAKHGGQ